MSGIPAKKDEWRACAGAVITACLEDHEEGAKAFKTYVTELGGEWDLAVNNVLQLKQEQLVALSKDLRVNPVKRMAAVEASIHIARADLHIK